MVTPATCNGGERLGDRPAGCGAPSTPGALRAGNGAPRVGADRIGCPEPGRRAPVSKETAFYARLSALTDEWMDLFGYFAPRVVTETGAEYRAVREAAGLT